MEEHKHVIKKSIDLYLKLKKNGFSDVQIRKIAQILSACSIEECQEAINPATGEITHL